MRVISEVVQGKVAATDVQSLRPSQQSPDPAVRAVALRILLSALRESDP